MNELPMEDVGITILSEQRCRLGEGPTYDPATNTAWWLDILDRMLFQADLASGLVTVHTLPVLASMVALIDDDSQLLAADNGLYVRDITSGRLTLLKPLESDNPATRSNDGRIHPCGALWIGTMGRNGEHGAGAIYRFHRGELSRLYADITIPNAICFSPDGATAYFTDTRKAILHRVTVDPATAMPLGEPEILYDHRSGQGGLDGAVVDAEGLIWNARWGGSCVDVYTPQGQRLRSLRVPAKQPSCPVFVGSSFDRLLVTSAGEGAEDGTGIAESHQGKTFILDVGAIGRPEPRVRLA